MFEFEVTQAEMDAHKAAEAECNRVGHDFSGDGYRANTSPDSGSETFDCKRCGYYDQVVYY